MKVKDLVRALGEIDDKYLMEEYTSNINEEHILQKSNNFKKEKFRRKVIVMDRKVLGIAAIAILAVVILGVSAINKNKGESVGPITELVQIANPITEVENVQEMKKYLGFDVPVLDKEIETYIVIGDKNYATHARIIYKDETQFEMEKGNSDVSGIYGGELVKEETINNINVKFYSYENIKFANWSKNGFSYSYQNRKGEINQTELYELLNK